MSNAKHSKYYLTTPIYYVNARPHIGHAYTTIVADVLARRHRLQGDDTFFLTGTDEHGQKIERSAAAAGIAPQQFADGVSAQFRSLWDRMDLTYDRYIRTTDECHKKGVQKLFTTLYEAGYIYLSTYTGAYCVSDEAFVDLPVGTPCPDCGRILEQVTEENFFFKLSEFQKPLLELIERGELRIEPETARNEVRSFLLGNYTSILAAAESHPDCPADIGSWTPRQSDELLQRLGIVGETQGGQRYHIGALKDLSISRSSFTWGIPVPEAIQKAAGTTQNHVVYVWLDALANYMTAIGYGSDDPKDQAEFAKFWPADLHLVGKEITRFHCVYWPAFLLAAKLPLPKRITANGWLLFDNAKMSKSRGNVVRSETILEAFGEHVYATQFPESTKRERDLFATDVLRYFLLREIPFGQDGSFSFDAMVTRYNADLANGYGNLVSRTLSMIDKYFEGRIPTPVFEETDESHLTPDGFDAGLLSRTASKLIETLQGLNETDFATYLAEVNAFIAVVDGFITTNAPWKLAKDPDKAGRLATVLYVVAEAIRCITIKLHAICPFSTARVWQQLGFGRIEDAIKQGEFERMYWGGLHPATKLGALAPIFPRAEKSLAETMIDMENENTLATQNSQLKTENQTVDAWQSATPPATPAVEAAPSAAAAPITIDDFAKIELRIAQVLVAERIPKADKLLRLEVDLGDEKRQILSGIAEWYAPEDLIGRRIIAITNLAPRKMRGLESHGMLLAASEEGGKPFLATVPEGVPLGTRLK